MAHIKIQPPGVMPLDPCDRKPIYHVVSGDTWDFTVNLYSPENFREPATPDNTIVSCVVAETQFDKPLWMGLWYNGVKPDEKRAGLCHIAIPREVTKTLRRGSYMFSVRVSDLLLSRIITQAEGSFLVEYKPTSENHDIPYKKDTNSTETTGEEE